MTWRRHHTAPRHERDYPETIPGRLTLRSGDVIALTAHRTAEVDDTGCLIYELRAEGWGNLLPITQADYLAGGISISIDVIPAMSGMRFGFLLDGRDS